MTDTELSNIPGALKELRQWVCVYASSKIPMRPETGAAASASDPDTWTDFGTAAQAVSEGIFDYTGFVFAGGGLIGIDIDAGFDGDGLMSRMCRDIVHACASYTQRQVSRLRVITKRSPRLSLNFAGMISRPFASSE